MLVCLNRGSTLYEPLTGQARFGVSVLMADQAEIAAQFGASASRAARFSMGQWDEVLGVPLLRGAQAGFVCRRAHHTPFGTHDIVIGTIEEAVSGARIDPLLYLDAGFARAAPHAIQAM